MELNIRKIDMYECSIFCQVKGKWQTKDEKLRLYQEYLSELARKFEEIEFTILGREGNHFADVLVTLASITRIDFGHKVRLVYIDTRNNPTHCCSVEREIVGNLWYYDIKNFIQNQTYPMGAFKINKKTSRRLAMDFYLDGETWNKKSSNGTLLRCLDNVEAKSGEEFMERDLICRYGPLEKINNAQNFNNKMIIELCAKWKIKHSNSLLYRRKMNGVVEAANKNVKKIISKMVVTYKDGHEMLPFALHAYRTAIRTSTGATPYTLVYEMEAVMPLEVETPSLRVLVDFEFRRGGMGKS